MTNKTAPHHRDVPTRSRVLPHRLLRAAWAGHRALLWLSGGHIGLRRPRADRPGLLRLRTLGRRSGQVRRAILAYVEQGEDILVLAANGMEERPPSWWLNLQTTPDAIVDLPEGPRDVCAHEAVGDERERLWQRWLELDAGLDGRAASLRRRIPLVVLAPRP
ncbi:MAG: nitroreductase/quinone reductase family protein [Anaerolineae bacterium]